MNSVDWYRWHDSYDELESSAAERLADIQRLLSERLTAARAGSIRLLSMAAGQSRDLIPVLINHPRGAEVSAVLVESDSRNTDLTEGALHSAALSRVSIISGDAGSTDNYASGVPADLVLCCGVFEHLCDADLRRTVQALPMLCAQGAAVIYSHGDGKSRSIIESELTAAGFMITAVNGGESQVGCGVLTGAAPPWRPGVRMFELR